MAPSAYSLKWQEDERRAHCKGRSRRRGVAKSGEGILDDFARFVIDEGIGIECLGKIS
jgi:hypothetical protein